MKDCAEPAFTTDIYSGEVIVQFSCEDTRNTAVLDNALSAYFASQSEGGRIDKGVMPAYGPALDEYTGKLATQFEKASSTTTFAAMVSLNAFYRVPMHDRREHIEPLIRHLKGYGGIRHAYAEFATAPSSVKVTNDPLAANEAYIEAAPKGVGASLVWNARPGADGKETSLVDVELGWSVKHKELAHLGLTGVHFGDMVPATNSEGQFAINHGTSVLGVIAAADDAAGGIGMAPNVKSVRLHSCYDKSTNTANHVAKAIVTAVAKSEPGTVILIEVQRGPCLPTEVDDMDFHAIRMAVAHGMIVVEAAGNGGADLGTVGPPYGFLDPGSPNWRGDSGAIIVAAAGLTYPGWDPLTDTNYGARVDLFADGLGVATSGCTVDDVTNTVADFASINHRRRKDFSRTSAAAAIVAGAALIAQGIALASGSKPLSSLDVRDWLKRSGAKTKIAPGVTVPFGVMPDLTRLGRVPKPKPISLGPVLGSGMKNPPQNVFVTQLGDGLVGLVPPSPTGLPPAPQGEVHTNAGQTGGSAPTSGSTSTEAWACKPGFEGAIFTDPNNLILQWTSGVPATGLQNWLEPTGFPSTMTKYHKASNFVYQSPVPTSSTLDASNPKYYDILQPSGSTTVVGQLCRCNKGGVLTDRWMLNANFKLVGPNMDMKLVTAASPAAGSSVANWLVPPPQNSRTWYAEYTFIP